MIRPRRLFSMVGSSGTGKSTLLDRLNKMGMRTVELSGRPYLPKEGDYVSNKSDIINRRIAYGSTVTFASAILNHPDEDIFFSRCAVDKLAYGRALAIGQDLHDIAAKEIVEVVIPHITVFYLPIEFPLPIGEDEVRGNNEEVRRDTDRIIQNVLSEYQVPHIVVSGTVQERMDIILKHILS